MSRFRAINHNVDFLLPPSVQDWVLGALGAEEPLWPGRPQQGMLALGLDAEIPCAKWPTASASKDAPEQTHRHDLRPQVLALISVGGMTRGLADCQTPSLALGADRVVQRQ